MGRVAVKIDCSTCDQTGYDNYYTQHLIPAYYRPGAVKEWDANRGGTVFLGECGIKVDAVFEDILSRTMFLEVNGIRWNFTRLSDPGLSYGQRRIRMALSRKA